MAKSPEKELMSAPDSLLEKKPKGCRRRFLYVGDALVRRIPVCLSVGKVIGDQLHRILQYEAPNAHSRKGNEPGQVHGIGRHKRPGQGYR